MVKILKTAVEEVWGLFVDDPIFAASLILWLVLTKLIAEVLPHTFSGLVLFVGLALLLVGLSYRQAKVILHRKNKR